MAALGAPDLMIAIRPAIAGAFCDAHRPKSLKALDFLPLALQ
jgi:hypothetical protein